MYANFKGLKMKNKCIAISIFLLLTLSLEAVQTKKLVWPSPPDEPRIEFINSIRDYKDTGVEKGFFTKVYDFIMGEDISVISSPFGLHVDDEKIYITDITSKSIHVFDKNDYDKVKIEGSDKETFLYPVDIVTDKRGNIYVSDALRAKVYVFEEDGEYQFSIKPKELQRPVGIAVNNDKERLYIVDALASKIHITDLKGKFVKSIGSKGLAGGEFNRPTFIDIAQDGKLYISDSMNHRIQILDSEGRYIHSFGKLSQNIGGFGNPRGIALDSNENIYVTDTMYNTIQIFNKKGELLMVFGNYGFRDGEFSLPEDISITSDNEIYISDTNNKRLQLFKLLDQNNKRSVK